MRGSRIFSDGGGGGGSRPDGQRTVWTTFFLFLVLNLFYNWQRGPMVLLQRKLYFAKDPEGSNIIFQGARVQLIQGGGRGPNANFYKNRYNLWFSRGWSEPPPPPLWIGTWTRYLSCPYHTTTDMHSRCMQKKPTFIKSSTLLFTKPPENCYSSEITTPRSTMR